MGEAQFCGWVLQGNQGIAELACRGVDAVLYNGVIALVGNKKDMAAGVKAHILWSR